MKSKFIPERYALALYEVAEEHNSLELVEKDMSFLRTIFEKAPQILNYCLQFHGDQHVDMDFIETAFFPYVGEYTKEMFRIAVKNGRLSIFPFLPVAFDSIRDKKNDTITVKIETAHFVPDETITLLSRKMRERIKKNIKIETMVNSTLLGGFRILWQNKVIDQSAAGRLKKFRNILVDRI